MNAVVQLEQRALAHQPAGRMAVADIISHVALVQEVMRAVMKTEVHYGIIPGTDKPTLLKQGAEVLCMAFRVADSYQVEDLSTADMVRYRVTCTGTHQTSGVVLGSGMGEASSSEEKYKWRKAYEPEFNETPANMRRKKSGYNKQKREHYSTFQVRTEPADLANTILKMANKRAKIAMTINVTACGDMFGQDLEDMDEALRDHLTRHPQDADAGEQQEGARKPAVNMPQAKPRPAEGATDAEPKAQSQQPEAGGNELATAGEIAYLNKKITAKGWTIAQAREAAQLDAGETLDGLTKDGFVAMKDALL